MLDETRKQVHVEKVRAALRGIAVGLIANVGLELDVIMTFVFGLTGEAVQLIAPKYEIVYHTLHKMSCIFLYSNPKIPFIYLYGLTGPLSNKCI